MKVVGHVEQMRASACYQGSDTMTCITCHDPHGSPQPEERIAYYRERCGACHSAGCKLNATARLAKVADDNCVACHMPQKPTDLAHFAFTHHRIGLHNNAPASGAPAADEQQPVTLVPMSDLAPHTAADRERLFGLAYLEFAHLHGRPQDRASYLRRAKRHLIAARDGGADDALLEAGIAQIAWNNAAHAEAITAARRSLLFPDLETGSHATAWFVLADSFVVLKQPAEAEAALQPLLENRRMAEHWILLAQCRLQTGDSPGALEALLLAARASPFRADIQARLAELYRDLGDNAQADRHRAQSEYLQQQPAER
jgi:predicted Zn-dependent protease